MKPFFRLGLLLGLYFGGASRSYADMLPKTVVRCKQATASVLIGDRYSGTAFHIGSGLFLTTAQVVNLADSSHKITLILDTGERTQKRWKATLLRTNQLLDFALLQVSEMPLPPALELGDASSLIETLAVTAFGYPSRPEPKDDSLLGQAIMVNKGYITSLPKTEGELQRIQVDAAFDAGDAGGPLVNEAGRVLGVIVAAPEAKSTAFALPINQVRRFLYGPLPPEQSARKGASASNGSPLKVLVTPQSTDDEAASPDDLHLNIKGVPYKSTGTHETMEALFSQPDGGISTRSYSGYIFVEVSGYGVSYGKDAPNDAFYLFNSGVFSTPKNGHDGGFYQLTFGTETLTSRNLGNNATHFLIGPVPPYNPAHKYTFVLNTRLSQPGRLHFGVSDGGYDGNEGIYTIKITQLAPVR